MNTRKAILVVLIVVIVSLGAWAAWKTMYHTDSDGHGHNLNATHENNISQILSWMGSMFSARPTVHDPAHEEKIRPSRRDNHPLATTGQGDHEQSICADQRPRIQPPLCCII